MSRYVFKALDGATAPGPGPELLFNAPTRFSGGMQPIITGAPSDVSVQAEMTINGTDWFAISGVFSIANNVYVGGVGAPLIKGWRLNVQSITGGSSPTVSVDLAVEEQPPV